MGVFGKLINNYKWVGKLYFMFIYVYVHSSPICLCVAMIGNLLFGSR